jgi:hypothetical protein
MKPAPNMERTPVVSWLAAPVVPEPEVPLPDEEVPFLPVEDEDEDEDPALGVGDAVRHIISQEIFVVFTSRSLKIEDTNFISFEMTRGPLEARYRK